MLFGLLGDMKVYCVNTLRCLMLLFLWSTILYSTYRVILGYYDYCGIGHFRGFLPSIGNYYGHSSVMGLTRSHSKSNTNRSDKIFKIHVLEPYECGLSLLWEQLHGIFQLIVSPTATWSRTTTAKSERNLAGNSHGM